MQIGKTIRKYRKEKGLTQEEMANCLGVTTHYFLSMKTLHFVKAHLFTDKQQALANIFEMGKYHEAACKLDLATAEQDVDTVLNTMEEMLHSLNELTSFSSSSLYEHMDFNKKPNHPFSKQLKQELLHLFQDKETYAFLKDNERWQKLLFPKPSLQLHNPV